MHEMRQLRGGGHGQRRVTAAADVEEALAGLVGVMAVRLVTRADGMVEAVHVAMEPAWRADTVRRDVQALLMHRFGLQVDPDAIHVVQQAQPHTPRTQQAQREAQPTAQPSQVNGASAEQPPPGAEPAVEQEQPPPGAGAAVEQEQPPPGAGAAVEQEQPPPGAGAAVEQEQPPQRATGSAPEHARRRPALAEVRVVLQPDATSVDVELRTDLGRLHGSARLEGPDGLHAAVATATLAALAETVGRTLEPVAVDVIDVGRDRIAIATVVASDGRSQQRLTGSALVRGHVEDAMTRAVLDATNSLHRT